MHKIFIQGEMGSFHHEAAVKLFNSKYDIVPCSSFDQVFDQIKGDNIGLSAIENSLYGSINEVYDLIEKSNVKIIGETELSINQNLIGLQNSDLGQVKEIYSHPVALAQCEHFLDKNFPDAERISFEDTAAAVRHINEENNPEKFAIASSVAAELYGAKVFINAIQDNPVNYTRFIAVADRNSKNMNSLKPPKKASIVLTTSHKPGALYEALGIFVKHQINLTKLQSRPVIGEKWSYKFYLDFETELGKAQTVVNDLIKIGNKVSLLGVY